MQSNSLVCLSLFCLILVTAAAGQQEDDEEQGMQYQQQHQQQDADNQQQQQQQEQQHYRHQQQQQQQQEKEDENAAATLTDANRGSRIRGTRKREIDAIPEQPQRQEEEQQQQNPNPMIGSKRGRKAIAEPTTTSASSRSRNPVAGSIVPRFLIPSEAASLYSWSAIDDVYDHRLKRDGELVAISSFLFFSFCFFV